MHSSMQCIRGGATGLQGSRPNLLTHSEHSQNSRLRSAVSRPHGMQRRHSAAARWPCQAIAPVDISIEYDSPQVSKLCDTMRIRHTRDVLYAHECIERCA